jgi:CubicO group peptidase (beta-lactamase class C family)
MDTPRIDRPHCRATTTTSPRSRPTGGPRSALGAMCTAALAVLLVLAAARPALAEMFSPSLMEAELRASLRGMAIGSAFEIYKDGALVASGSYGLRRTAADGAKPFSRFARQNLASVSKTITAVALVRLLDERKIDVFSPVRQYWPKDWKFHSSNKDISFAQLMQHKAGLRGGGSLNADCQAALGRKTMPADRRYHYDNVNYACIRVLMSRIIDGSSTPNAYRDYVLEKVLRPAGVDLQDGAPQDTRFYRRPGIYQDGEKGVSFPQDLNRLGGTDWILSVHDVGKILVTLERTNRIVQQQDWIEMKTVGMGVKLDGELSDDDYYFGHGGYLRVIYEDETRAEDNTRWSLFPNGVLVVVFANSALTTDGLGFVIDDAWNAGWVRDIPAPSNNLRRTWGGLAGDRPVPADYTGDGLLDFAVVRLNQRILTPTATMTWHVADERGVSWWADFGLIDDVPVPANYDGVGGAEIAVYRPSNGTWYVRDARTNGYASYRFGLPDDIPVPGDYDGDGEDEIAVYRPSESSWYICLDRRRCTTDMRYVQVVYFGAEAFHLLEASPVPADYDGDGIDDLALYGSGAGPVSYFVIRPSGSGRVSIVPWGTSGDIPVPADFAGSRAAEIAVYRPSDGTFYVSVDNDGRRMSTVRRGLPDDVPLPGKYFSSPGVSSAVVWRPRDGSWQTQQTLLR